MVRNCRRYFEIDSNVPDLPTLYRTAGTCLAFLRPAPVLCGGGARYTATICDCHSAPLTGPFSPQLEHGWGEKGPVEGLVDAHGL